jgi:hypothetical protein
MDTPNAPPDTDQRRALDAATTMLHQAWVSALMVESGDMVKALTPNGFAPTLTRGAQELLPLELAKEFLFLSVVAGLGFHHRVRAEYDRQLAATQERNRNAQPGTKEELPETNEEVLVRMRPDPVDRALLKTLPGWLVRVYEPSMNRKYTDPVPAEVTGLPAGATVMDMRNAYVKHFLAAAPRFRRDVDRDYDLVVDLQAGILQAGPRGGTVTEKLKADEFLSQVW